MQRTKRPDSPIPFPTNDFKKVLADIDKKTPPTFEEFLKKPITRSEKKTNLLEMTK